MEQKSNFDDVIAPINEPIQFRREMQNRKGTIHITKNGKTVLKYVRKGIVSYKTIVVKPVDTPGKRRTRAKLEYKRDVIDPSVLEEIIECKKKNYDTSLDDLAESLDITLYALKKIMKDNNIE